ncbi:MAG: hypothetical protein JXR48_11650 [Candidatus Delongbacteria bacterium]|nr:hypothetical protein [Candidatus Delongbacteria bacterium]
MGKTTIRHESRLEVWKYYSSYIQNLENKQTIIFSAIIVILGFLFIYGFSSTEANKLLAKQTIFFVVPLLLFSAIMYYIITFRTMIIAGAYIRKLESDLNKEIDSNVFIWENKLIVEFIDKSHIYLFFLIFEMITGLATAYIICKQIWAFECSVTLKILYYLIILIQSAFCIVQYSLTNKTKREVYAFLTKNNSDGDS